MAVIVDSTTPDLTTGTYIDSNLNRNFQIESAVYLQYLSPCYSNNIPNILTNQGINAYLQSQTNSFDWSAIDANILSGRSIKEINELITGSVGGQSAMQQPPPHQHPPPVAPQTAYPYHSFEPKRKYNFYVKSNLVTENYQFFLYFQ